MLPKGQLRRIAKRIADRLEARFPPLDPSQPVDISPDLPAGIGHSEEIDVIVSRLQQLGWTCHASIYIERLSEAGGNGARKTKRMESTERLQDQIGNQIAFDLVPPGPRSVILHIGPTNSGKTHQALQRLAGSKHGLYLAPLRLLAWEAADRLNEGGCPTDLLTGEEYVPAPNPRVTAATTEMFPHGRYDVVVIDEAQMVADPDRGYAWLRAMIKADTEELHVCAAPQAERFLRELFTSLGDTVTINRYERLAPLRPLREHITLENLPERSAVIAFSRSTVLRLKAEIEAIHKKPCAVIYGALPPDVRREQARRVREGECKYVVGTDSIGMGVNFPVDFLFLWETAKFDGQQERVLYPAEALQIIGRAGRYGLSETGWYGGMSKVHHEVLLELAAEKPLPIQTAYLQPTIEQLTLLSGRLAKRLQVWQTLAEPGLPERIRISPLEQMIELARQLPPKLEEDLPRAFMLVTAPVSKESLPYWQSVTTRLAENKKASVPPAPLDEIRTDADLAEAESCLKQHELALWLVRRGVPCRASEPRLRSQRDKIAEAINQALSKGLTLGGCRICGNQLPPDHRFRICQPCFERRAFKHAPLHSWPESPKETTSQQEPGYNDQG